MALTPGSGTKITEIARSVGTAFYFDKTGYPYKESATGTINHPATNTSLKTLGTGRIFNNILQAFTVYLTTNAAITLSLVGENMTNSLHINANTTIELNVTRVTDIQITTLGSNATIYVRIEGVDHRM